MRSRWAALTMVVVMTLPLLNCSSGATTVATPIITGIFPDSIVAGSANFILTITGLNFSSRPPSVALWNGSPRTTAINPSTGQLAVTILASDVSNTGVGLVTVMNPAPGGTTLTPVSFSIIPLMKGAPAITSLNPSSANPGTKGPFLLTVNGTGFVAGSIIRWNGTFRQPDTVSATALTTNLTTNDLAAAGIASVSVDNPLPGGIIASSVAVDFTIGSGMAAFPQVISVNTFGGPSNGQSAAPAISADGRFVAFYSQAKNLVERGASGNIFVRDTCLGAADCTPHTRPVDLTPDGSAPDAHPLRRVAISADGRFVAFTSSASNLVLGVPLSANLTGTGITDDRRLNVFVRDLCVGANVPEGCTPHTEIITRDTNGQRTYGVSPSLSGDGRFVAFGSGAPNLAADMAAPQTYLYVRDTCAGPSAKVACLPKTIPLSLDNTNPPGNGQAAQPVISISGRYVAYQVWAAAGTIVAHAIPSQIFLRDMCLGADAPAACVPSTVRISVAPDGSPLKGLNDHPSLGSDGRFVVFESQSADAKGGEFAATRSIFLRDTCLGPTAPDGCIPSTKLIYSQPAADPSAPDSVSPAISPSGRFISFVAGGAGTGLDTIGAGSLFIHDTCFGASTGCTPATNPIFAFGAGLNARPLIVGKFTPAALTADGRFAAFFSVTPADASMPVSGHGDVFLTATPFR